MAAQNGKKAAPKPAASKAESASKRTRTAKTPAKPKTAAKPDSQAEPKAADRFDELQDTVATLRSVFAGGRTRSAAWRQAQLSGIERLLTEREDDIAEAIGADLGRNAHDAWFGEIVGTQGEIAHAKRNLRRWMRPQRTWLPLIQQPGLAQVRYEPLGVALIIGPWNYPVFLTLSPLVAALAAGNAVVIKPSELAPATSALLARLLPQYLDPEAVVVVEGDAQTTQQLLSLGFDHAFFTGGTEVGRKIMAAAAPTLTPVTLELGGKSPVIIAADADLDVAARRIAWVKLMNSGQTCIAPDYVLVDESVKDRLVHKITATLKEFRAGEPAGQRIVNERQFDRLAGYLQATKGTVVAGGGVDAEALTVEPTVVVEPDADEPLMTEEIFGPILPVIPVSSTAAAIRYVNRGPKPLALYVFSRSRSVARKVVDEVPAGGAVINHIALHCLVPHLPFGGVGDSGIGAYHGVWGFETFSHRKAVLHKTNKPDLQLVYPPYTEQAKKILRRLF